jgi:hypothetical protein
VNVAEQRGLKVLSEDSTEETKENLCKGILKLLLLVGIFYTTTTIIIIDICRVG